MNSLSEILFYTVEKKRYKGRCFQLKSITLTDNQISYLKKNIGTISNRQIAKKLKISYEKLMCNIRIMKNKNILQ